MPIELTLKRTMILDDNWMAKEDWDEFYKDNLPELIELLNEDWLAVIEQAGGLEGLIESARWIPAQEVKKA